ncbi:MAG: hypothetical protein EON61_00850 [Alphaproteobacteria bacterium]|nr:MAG: hypothetical protein EON61_00850 [Alphaproteobacteria bacterium]
MMIPTRNQNAVCVLPSLLTQVGWSKVANPINAALCAVLFVTACSPERPDRAAEALPVDPVAPAREDPDADIGEPLFIPTHPLDFVRVLEFGPHGAGKVRVLWRSTDGNGNAYYQELLYVCDREIGAVLREGKGWGTEGRAALLAAKKQPEDLYKWQRESEEYAVGAFACKNRGNQNWDLPG